MIAAFSSIVVVVMMTSDVTGLGALPWPWSIVVGLGWTVVTARLYGNWRVSAVRRRAVSTPE